jgi:hypothetical protein
MGKVGKDKMTKQVEKSTGIVTPAPVGPGTTPPVKFIPTFYTRLFEKAKKGK